METPAQALQEPVIPAEAGIHRLIQGILWIPKLEAETAGGSALPR